MIHLSPNARGLPDLHCALFHQSIVEHHSNGDR